LVLRLFTVDETNSLVYFTEVMASDQTDPDSAPANGNGTTPMEDDEAAVSIDIVNMPNSAVNRSAGTSTTAVFVTDLYPNPASGLMTLEIDSKVTTGAELMIYNITGSLVLRNEIELTKDHNEVIINVSNLPEGAYLIRVPGQAVSQRFLKVNRP